MTVVVLLALFCITVYYLPSFIALMRGKNFGGVFVINLLTGWTILGWFAALMMACWQREAQISYVLPPQPNASNHTPLPAGYPSLALTQYGELAE